MENHEIWKAVLAQMELSLSRANFVTWFKGTSITSNDDGVYTVSVPNGFAKEWLENKYKNSVIQAIRQCDPQAKEFRCVISGPNPSLDATTVKKSVDAVRISVPAQRAHTYPSSPTMKTTSLYHESNLNPKYTFESFVVAENNELSRAACLAVSQNLGTAYNPLFIYGGVGLGKTHLLQSLGNAVKTAYPGKIIKYITSERFTSELVDSIKNHNVDTFKEYYQEIDLLIIDDIQFLSGREKTQQEFFHIFNALYQLNKQIVISSDRPPKEIATLEDRLRSRFEGGMIADISRPNFETRFAILKRKLSEKEVSISDDVVKFIAENITDNIRELEGALNRVIAYSEFYRIEPTVTAAEKILAQLIVQGRKNLLPKDILEAIIKYYGVAEDNLKKKGRKKEISHPRQVAMYLIRSELKMPFSSIGELFGGRDHTTTLHAFEKIEHSLSKNLRLKGEINSIKELLYHS